LLIKFEGNWADEMDIYGFTIMTVKQWEYKKNEIRHTPLPIEVCFGTNESEEYETHEEYLRNFKVIEITKAEVKVLKKLFLFNLSDYGNFSLIEGEAPNEFYDEYGYYAESED